MLAGSGAVSVADAIRQRKTTKIVLALVVVLFVLPVVIMDTGVPSRAGNMRFAHILRLVERNRIDEAVEVASKMPVGEMNPAYWRLKLARAYTKTGAFLEAEHEYKKILGLAPDHVPTICELGGLYLQSGDYNKAVIELEKGHELSPGNKICKKLLLEAKEK